MVYSESRNIRKSHFSIHWNIKNILFLLITSILFIFFVYSCMFMFHHFIGAAAAFARNTTGVLSTSLPSCNSHHRHSSSNLVLHSENIKMTTSSDSSESDPNNSYDINQQKCCSETATSASSCSSCCACGGGSLSCCSGSTSGFGSNSSDLSLTSSVNYPGMKSKLCFDICIYV